MFAGGMGMQFDKVIIPALIDESYIESLPIWIRDDCYKSVKNTEKIRGYWSYWPSNEYIGDLINLWETDEYTFLSQYMQEPIALGGNVFKSEWWKLYGEDESPAPARYKYRFITADTAQKTKTYNDFSVICEWGVNSNDDLYLIDMIRGKWEAPELEINFETFLTSSWNKNKELGMLRKVLVEDKSSGTTLIQNVGRRSPIKLTPVQRNIDKVSRAMDAAPIVKAGRVYLPADKKFTVEFIAEHSAFTYDDSHKHDDIVDNLMDATTEISNGKRPMSINPNILNYL